MNYLVEKTIHVIMQSAVFAHCNFTSELYCNLFTKNAKQLVLSLTPKDAAILQLQKIEERLQAAIDL
jgi:hypothetical protein